MITYAIAALMLIQSPPQQFDLVCTGTSITVRTVAGETFSETDAYIQRYRVDLRRGAWCQSDCSIVEEFVRVTPTELVMDRQSRGPGHTDLSINRTTGGMLSKWRGSASGSTLDSIASCSREPFTPMPEARF